VVQNYLMNSMILHNLKNQKLLRYHQQGCVNWSQTARQTKKSKIWQVQKINLFKSSKESALVPYGIILFMVFQLGIKCLSQVSKVFFWRGWWYLHVVMVSFQLWVVSRVKRVSLYIQNFNSKT